MFASGEQRSRVKKKQSYIFALILGIIIVVLILVFNFRDEQIEKLARTIFGVPK